LLLGAVRLLIDTHSTGTFRAKPSTTSFLIEIKGTMAALGFLALRALLSASICTFLARLALLAALNALLRATFKLLSKTSARALL
jgi:hypothetical protein